MIAFVQTMAVLRLTLCSSVHVYRVLGGANKPEVGRCGCCFAPVCTRCNCASLRPDLETSGGRVSDDYPQRNRDGDRKGSVESKCNRPDLHFKVAFCSKGIVPKNGGRACVPCMVTCVTFASSMCVHWPIVQLFNCQNNVQMSATIEPSNNAGLFLYECTAHRAHNTPTHAPGTAWWARW